MQCATDVRRLVSGKGPARVANTFIQPSETTAFLLDRYLTCLTFLPLQLLPMGDYVVPLSSPLDTLARQCAFSRLGVVYVRLAVAALAQTTLAHLLTLSLFLAFYHAYISFDTR